MRTIKVLQFLPPTFGGIDSYIFTHYKYMDQEKFQFDFLTRNQELAGAEQYRNFHYNVRLLPTTASADKDRFAQYVKEVLKDKYDVFHLHTGYWTGFLLEEIAKEIGTQKVIVHSHNSSVEENDSQRRVILLQRHEEIKQAFYPELATDFWACSWKAADWLFGSQIPRNKIRIMKNAIELERFRFDLSVRNRVRTLLGLNRDTLVLGTTGRLSYQKNHIFLLKLFREFHMRHDNSKLIIIGDGELRGDLETQIKEDGLKNSVLLLGWKTDVENYLSAMDCFLFPSRFEGLGIAAVEASASGLPCILSDQVPRDVAFTEHIRFVPLDIQEWMNALEEVAWQHVDRQAGVDVVRAAGYDVQEQAKELESLYLEM